MTYFGFLIRFLIIPIFFLSLIVWIDRRRGVAIPARFRAFNPYVAILLNVVVAVAYTTLWDNYLVASGVWSYNPDLVAGIVIGYVPIEEYTFFVLQPILAGLWLLLLLPRLHFPADPSPLDRHWRRLPLFILAILWTASLLVLLSGWAPGTYLGLELVWALPPIMLQVGFGGDILRRYASLVLACLIPLTIYLSLMDAIAISSGTWHIDPAQTLPFLIGGVLPVEELVFFLLTNTLITLGMVLILSEESMERIKSIKNQLISKPGNPVIR